MKACLRSILASACCLMATAALAGPRIVFDAGEKLGPEYGKCRAVLRAMAEANQCTLVAEGSGAGAVAAYRKALAAASDRGVIFCAVGDVANLRKLLESKADAVSKMDGRTLVEKKVYCLYQTPRAGLVEKWPTPVVFADSPETCVFAAARVPKSRRTDEAITSFRRCKLEKTATGIRMLRDGKTLWNFEIDTPEGRPFFHPLNLPSGRPLTDCRPKDHVWHLGYWFSWKFIDGVNYWEPADEKREGHEPAGETKVTKKSHAMNGHDCAIDLELAYGPRGSKEPTLTERRRIVIDPPDPRGGYVITVRHTFTAQRDCTLDRTPPHGSTASGKWGGGYAGPTLRLHPDAAAAFKIRGFAAGDGAAAVTGRETKFVDLTDPTSGEGVRFTQLAAPKTAKFYVWPDGRFVTPSALYDGPVSLKKGETLELAYKLAVHADGRVKGALAKRPVERMDRGLVVALTPQGTYLSWRLLETDRPDRGCDVDADGCDEVLIGSLCLDQDGTVLWNTERGHSDAHYYGDIDPNRPGMELFYVYETAQRHGGGLFMCDPVTGEEIWKLPDPTLHVHGSGICSDIAPEYPGLEIYGQEADQSNGKATRKQTHRQSDNRWFYTADGHLLSSFTNCTYRYDYGASVVWWDGDLQRITISYDITRKDMRNDRS